MCFAREWLLKTYDQRWAEEGLIVAEMINAVFVS